MIIPQTLLKVYQCTVALTYCCTVVLLYMMQCCSGVLSHCYTDVDLNILLHHCTVAQFHCCSIALLHAPLLWYTVSSLSYIALLHAALPHCPDALFHHCPDAALHCSTVAALHCCTVAHYCPMHALFLYYTVAVLPHCPDALFHHALPWCSIALLHCCSNALLHHCPNRSILFHHCPSTLLPWCSIAFLLCCTVAPLPWYMHAVSWSSLLSYCTVAALHVKYIVSTNITLNLIWNCKFHIKRGTYGAWSRRQLFIKHNTLHA